MVGKMRELHRIKPIGDKHSFNLQSNKKVYSSDCLEISHDAKGVSASMGIIFVHSRHVECIIMMQNCGRNGK